MTKTKIECEDLLSEFGRGLKSNAIRKLTLLLGRREVISFAAGAPSPDTFPLEELAEIAARLIRDRGHAALQYGPTRGQSALVEAVAAKMQERGVAEASPANIVLTSGSQQGLDLLARILIDPGDVVFAELPSYIGGIIALQNSRAELVGVRQDDGGIIIGDLRDKIKTALSQGRRLKCVYTIPNFQNPSGVTLAAERRGEIVKLAEEFDLLIIEDDAYYDLYFSQSAAQRPPLAALGPERVVYLSTFSKTLAPGLRSGWLCAPAAIASRVELAKEGADLSSSVFDQAIVSEAVSTGLIERRLPALRDFYRSRCQAMLEALDGNAPADAHWTKPLGGFFILMEFDRDLDTGLLQRAIDHGVAYVPGEPFFVNGGGKNALRLAFSKEPEPNIRTGIKRLCEAIKAS